MTVRVVVVRPWVDPRGGGGCCGGEVRDGIAPAPLQRSGATGHHHLEGGTGTHPDTRAGAVTEVHRRLRREHPGIDTQVTPANNVWLPGWAFRRVRARHGLLRAVSAATVAMRPGAVLVDGLAVARLEDGGEAVGLAVHRALGAVPTQQPS